jgi:hypothetical protein
MRPTRRVAVDKSLCFPFKEIAMRLVCGIAILGLSFGLLALAAAQTPKDRPTDKEVKKPEEKKAADKEDKANSPAVKNLVDRLMVFDKNKDGKLEKDEITDPRRMRLFERADANKDGVVTKEEVTAMAVRMIDESGGRQGGFGPPGGPGGPPGGPPSRLGSGAIGPPRPGQLLPPFLQDRLKLTAEQKKQLEELQKEIDSKLDKILTEEQRNQLKEMRGGFGPRVPGSPPGRRPGGPPPGGSPSRPPR